MSLYSFDPLRDPRWARFVQGHPKASIFHTAGWLRSLQRTYRFVPIAFTTSGPAEELGNALAFCGVRSWLTGDRLVSLPFSDHCDPLVRSDDELQALCLGVEMSNSSSRLAGLVLNSLEQSSQFRGQGLNVNITREFALLIIKGLSQLRPIDRNISGNS